MPVNSSRGMVGKGTGPAPDTRGTALHVAAALGNDALLKVLLEHRLAVDAHDKNGETPLHAASQGRSPGHRRCVELRESVFIVQKNCIQITQLASISGATQEIWNALTEFPKRFDRICFKKIDRVFIMKLYDILFEAFWHNSQNSPIPRNTTSKSQILCEFFPMKVCQSVLRMLPKLSSNFWNYFKTLSKFEIFLKKCSLCGVSFEKPPSLPPSHGHRKTDRLPQTGRQASRRTDGGRTQAGKQLTNMHATHTVAPPFRSPSPHRTIWRRPCPPEFHLKTLIRSNSRDVSFNWLIMWWTGTHFCPMPSISLSDWIGHGYLKNAGWLAGLPLSQVAKYLLCHFFIACLTSNSCSLFHWPFLIFFEIVRKACKTPFCSCLCIPPPKDEWFSAND